HVRRPRGDRVPDDRGPERTIHRGGRRLPAALAPRHHRRHLPKPRRPPPMTLILTSMLFVPGGDERKLAKLDTLRAPALILDLEDAVAESRKPAARRMVAAALAEATTRVPLWVRVNPSGPEATVADLDAVVGPRLAGVVLPKVESAAEVNRVDWYLSALEAERGLPAGSVHLMANIESVAGLAHTEEIAAASPRLECLIFGAGDFSLDAGLDW